MDSYQDAETVACAAFGLADSKKAKKASRHQRPTQVIA